jgi:antitoxin (DNA-binding transcriptional repressor) of toxin-antitoxin stability system
LSQHLAYVREGHTLTVTDHGKAIARLVPVDGPTTLERLIAAGRVQPAKRPKRSVPKPVAGAVGTVSDLVIDQRR